MRQDLIGMIAVKGAASVSSFMPAPDPAPAAWFQLPLPSEQVVFRILVKVYMYHNSHQPKAPA